MNADKTAKAATGMTGFDGMTGGGLPAGRTTLVAGQAGSGKTVFALQTLVGGARLHAEPGIFVAFEEQSRRIIENAAAFGWDLPELENRGLFFLDAQPSPHLIQSGEFELTGMLSTLDAKIREMDARRIAFDAIDVVLALIDEPRVRQREMYRLHDWLYKRDLTGIITAKRGERASSPTGTHLEFMQFMVDCFVQLDHRWDHGISQRSIQVVKYRGASFEENVTPLVIGPEGMEISHVPPQDGREPAAASERVSTGIDRLDTMLAGGYHRGSSVLVTGAPGTAKTTLAGAFACAACERGENTLFVTFDSPGEEVVRNLSSVGLDLAAARDSGRLRMMTARSIRGNAERHLMDIRKSAADHRARCLVVDPLSALARRGNTEWSNSVVERLIDWTRSRGVTLLCTSLLDDKNPDTESTPLQVSTIADSWIHLNYVIHAGERNRGLTIVKSRGTGHSNQVRELILSDVGVTLEDVYTAEGEVLMGTLRREREQSQLTQRRNRRLEARRREIELENEAASLEARLSALGRELAFKREELDNLKSQSSQHESDQREMDRARLKHRGADTNHPGTGRDE